MGNERSRFEARMKELLGRRLEELRARIVAEVGAGARQEALRESPGDEIDQAELDEPRDMSLRMRERDAQLAQQIEAALTRLDEGDYGICLECGQCIDGRRLELVP